jgi:pyruvate,water dikinase
MLDDTLPAPLPRATDRGAFGGKAAQLAVAARCGLPVPRGLAVPAACVEAVARDDRRLVRALLDAVGRLRFPVAVRSSAVAEDCEDASFAGQYVTCLNVPSPPGVLEAVREIRESARSAAVLAYRARLKVDGPPRIGVVVQEMVRADAAGVLFTTNPLDGADEIVIEASWGLGEAVVAGLVTPDRFRIAPDGRVLERTPGRKDVAVRMRPRGGTEEVELSAELASALSLDDAQLQALHALARACEAAFGGTQDLEWAFSDGAPFLLQRRAVTRAGAPEAARVR